MDEEEQDWITSWRVHDHTAKLKREATVARDNAASYLMSACSQSEDPAVRGAHATYEAMQSVVEAFEKGQWS